ncbi:MAG: hypothetical protein E6889_05710 [Staphylococcus epidermidis]|nr:hypothetical protein [Staphylococcus epidermidis]
MKSLQLVKYDLISILKSPYTYLAFILVIGMTVFQASMMANYSSAHKVNIDMVFNLANWLFLFAGLLFIIKTITRDYSQGTIQLFMSRITSRMGYIITKTVSIVLISFLFTIIHYLVIIIIQSPAVIFTLGIFLILIVPFIQPFIPMIPNIGDDIQDSFKYIPFTYLTEKMTGEIKFSHWQWFISIASIVVLFIANMLYASKRDI